MEVASAIGGPRGEVLVVVHLVSVSNAINLGIGREIVLVVMFLQLMEVAMPHLEDMVVFQNELMVSEPCSREIIFCFKVTLYRGLGMCVISIQDGFGNHH
ncbi:unnamed protein product, partial [Ilex paraguariensis]